MRLAVLLLLLPTACGYHWDRDRDEARLAGGALPAVAVLPFDNLSFRRGLEIRLTRLIDDEVRARSPRAPTSPADADWLLEGRIVRADERVLSEDEEGRVRENSFVMVVEVSLKDKATEKLLGTYSVTEREPFSDRAGRIATLEQAEEEALRDAAESIVYWLEEARPEGSS